MLVQSRTVNGIFLARARESARLPAYFHKGAAGRWEPTYWHQALARVRETAIGLREDARIGAGDRVAILSRVRPEWCAADQATLSLGAVTVGLYDTAAPEQLAYVLRHSGAKALFVEDAGLFAKVAPALPDLPDVRRVYSFEPADAGAPGTPLPAEALRAKGASATPAEAERWENEALAVPPEALATLIYTSGTTGEPKGAKLTHGNLYSVVEATSGLIPLQAGSRSVCYLPLAHSLQRYANVLGTWAGVTGYFLHDPKSLGEVLKEAKPDRLAAVPRVLERIHDRIQAGVTALPAHRARIFRWAVSVGEAVSERQREGRMVLPHLLAERKLADALVFRRVRGELGGEMQLVVSGGAPLAPRISRFFHAIGILVIEGYGLTETSAPITANTPSCYRFGTVGKAIPGSTVRIGEGGEIEVSGPGVFQGYYRDEAATRAAFTEDGFFRTGDLGELDADGFLRITGRKKELIITSGGKNVAPSMVEEMLQRGSLVAQAVVIGDRRPYLSALIWPDPDAAAALARGREVPAAGDGAPGDLIAAVRREIEVANARLSHHEQVRRFDLLDEELTPESGLLTPTLKLRRGVFADRHGHRIEALYAGGGHDV